MRIPASRLATGLVVTLTIDLQPELPERRTLYVEAEGSSVEELRGLPDEVCLAVCFGGKGQRFTIVSEKEVATAEGDPSESTGPVAEPDGITVAPTEGGAAEAERLAKQVSQCDV